MATKQRFRSCARTPTASFAFFALLLAIPAAGTLDFMVIGDWGGLPLWPYKTPGEVGVAHELGLLASKHDAKYTLALGDNFYLSGVDSVNDARFNETFEQVFASESLQGVNHFRVLAGNHDHKGNCSAEIAYTAVSPRWHFPDYYYDFVENTDTGMRVHHVMIDTVLLAGQSSDSTGADLAGTEYPGPPDVARAEAQWQWINSTLSASTADYLLVAGHFPVWSICEHGPTAQLVRRLKPMLEAARASVYFAGHDHCAQHLDDAKGVQYHGVGAGIMVNPSTKHRDAVPRGALRWHHQVSVLGYLEGAFAHVSVSEHGLVVSHYSSSGQKLYEAPPVRPRLRGQSRDADGVLQV
eukprot:TRINITY_DN43745_c0_g1_i1.p1 TRINITY_DN43745_c0_g1~~TRINITY_DN43745_c0_g1_i1.p1  ORF type:complete len:353 (-),score=45.20 TRINITY_DN43745_c0_g1_i1:5-1063(-)